MRPNPIASPTISSELDMDQRRTLSQHQNTATAVISRNARSMDMASKIDVSDVRTVKRGARGCKSFGRDFPTRVSNAIYHAARRFGIDKLASLLEMNKDVLQRKLSPNRADCQLTVDEAERATIAMNDPAGAIEFARIAGLICLPMPRAEDGDLNADMAEVTSGFAEILREFAAAVADNRISPNEVDAIRKASGRFHATLNHLIGAMEAKAERRELVVDQA